MKLIDATIEVNGKKYDGVYEGSLDLKITGGCCMGLFFKKPYLEPKGRGVF